MAADTVCACVMRIFAVICLKVEQQCFVQDKQSGDPLESWLMILGKCLCPCVTLDS